jgi:ribulose-5-phosphate 4-epimerase/fuculose-1-phosphate aldolase
VNPFGVAWDGLAPDDLILVNKDGKMIEGGASGRLLNAAGEISRGYEVRRERI